MTSCFIIHTFYADRNYYISSKHDIGTSKFDRLYKTKSCAGMKMQIMFIRPQGAHGILGLHESKQDTSLYFDES